MSKPSSAAPVSSAAAALFGALLHGRGERGRYRGRSVAVVALFGSLLLLVVSCGTTDDTAAQVGTSEYTVAELHDYLGGPDESPVASRSDAADWLGRWVYFEALESELVDRGGAVTPEHESVAVAELTSADPDFVPGEPGGDVLIHQQAVIVAALEWSGEQVPIDSVATQPARFLCSSHILVASETEADAVLQRLDADEPFEYLAIELSLDVASGSVGGELGCVVEGTFVAPFEIAAYAAEPGDVVVAESDFGFHVIRVISSGVPTADNHPQLDTETLERMAAEARQTAMSQAESERRERQISILRDVEASTYERFSDQVRIHDRYGVWDPTTFRVVVEPASQLP